MENLVATTGRKEVSWRREWKRCHGNVPMIRQLVEKPVQKQGGEACHARRWGDPVAGLPRIGDEATEEHGKRSKRAQRARSTHGKTFHTTQQASTVTSRGYTFEAFEIVVEVVVLAVGEEVVVHVPFWRGTCRSRGGRGTRRG